MIDFRYHLVSIIAIFFALATGIILGAGPLDEQVDETLVDQIPQLRDENQQLRDQIVALEGDLAYEETFVDSSAPLLVGDLLVDRRVAIVALPGADEDQIAGIRSQVEGAGASISSTVTVAPTWSDPDSEPALNALAAELVVSGTTLPLEGTGYDRGAAVLAGALLRPTDEPSSDAEADQITAVATGYSEAGLATIETAERDGDPQATLAVVVAGPPPEDDVERRTNTLTSLVSALDQAAAGSVVGGPPAAAEEGGVITAVRENQDLAAMVSTVDSVDLSSGRVAVVFAAVQQEQGGTGQYGRVGTTDGALPVIDDQADES